MIIVKSTHGEFARHHSLMLLFNSIHWHICEWAMLSLAVSPEWGGGVPFVNTNLSLHSSLFLTERLLKRVNWWRHSYKLLNFQTDFSFKRKLNFEFKNIKIQILSIRISPNLHALLTCNLHYSDSNSLFKDEQWNFLKICYKMYFSHIFVRCRMNGSLFIIKNTCTR